MGSPPHTRGKEIRKDGSTRHPGITPAHAGKSKDMATGIVVCRDHPRTRGEKSCRNPPSLRIAGSPPHTRGKAQAPAQASPERRITPAHAGKSFGGCCRIHGRWDHPRTRGEKSYCQLYSFLFIGSPPHTRGKVKLYSYASNGNRITPAHAGKS